MGLPCPGGGDSHMNRMGLLIGLTPPRPRRVSCYRQTTVAVPRMGLRPVAPTPFGPSLFFFPYLVMCSTQ